MYATVWALVPPVVAIVLALITKEVYSSLFVGIVTVSYTHLDVYKRQISGLFCSIGNEVCRIDGAKKAKYHAAASILSNQVIACLLDTSIAGIQNCGIRYLPESVYDV